MHLVIPYSFAAMISWIEHGPTITNIRSSLFERMSAISFLAFDITDSDLAD
jgi:hypothetical protein